MRDDNVDAASRRVPTDVDAAPRRIPPDNHPNEMIPPVPDFPPTPTYFDPLEPIANLAGNLPHWRQDVCIYFVTFRLADSIPAERLHRWLAERDDWLARNPPPHSPRTRREYHDRFTERLERWLDRGYGSCVLREAREIRCRECPPTFRRLPIRARRVRRHAQSRPCSRHAVAAPRVVGHSAFLEILHGQGNQSALRRQRPFVAEGEF